MHAKPVAIVDEAHLPGCFLHAILWTMRSADEGQNPTSQAPERSGLLKAMKNFDLSRVEEIFYDFLHRDLNIKDFEVWVYTSDELKSFVGSDDYLALITLDFNSINARDESEKIIRKYADVSKFETMKMLDLLYKAITNNEDTGTILITFYDLYCHGYYFLDKLGLRYGLTCAVPPIRHYREDSWEDLSDRDRKELVDGFYPEIIKDIQDVIALIQNEQIIITGTKGYMGQLEYIDNRKS